MMIRKLNHILVLGLVSAIWIGLLSGCEGNESKSLTEYRLAGRTMGTSWSIIYNANDSLVKSKAIDSVLVAVNQSMSTYISSSIISQVNQAPAGGEILVDHYFKTVFLRAAEIRTQSELAFEPTVMPLVNAWGFGFEKKDQITDALIESLLPLIDFESIDLIETGNSVILHKSKAGVQLDFSAIAKGFGVDIMADLLDQKGVANYYAEIGGELRTAGLNNSGEAWRIGIEKPTDDAEGASAQGQNLQTIIALSGKSLATSGNYRNFYVEGGQKYAHTISPVTGRPALSNLLSASVIASDCMTADAWATALMVLGVEKAKKILQDQDDLAGYLIFADENGDLQTWTSADFADKLWSAGE